MLVFLLSCSSSLGKYFVEMIVVEQPRVLLEAFILFKKYLKCMFIRQPFENLSHSLVVKPVLLPLLHQYILKRIAKHTSRPMNV